VPHEAPASHASVTTALPERGDRQHLLGVAVVGRVAGARADEVELERLDELGADVFGCHSVPWLGLRRRRACACRLAPRSRKGMQKPEDTKL